jgi:hypothetical protein
VPQDDRLALPIGQAAQRGEHLAMLLAEQGPRLGGFRVGLKQRRGDLTGPRRSTSRQPFSTLERA